MPPPKKRSKIIIIDSNALIHRAYHALPPLTTRKGELVNALYGFLLILFRAIKDVEPDYVFAAFDLPGPTFRHEEFKEYKAKRVKAPDELYAQIPLIKAVLGELHVPIFEKEGFEADDVIGTLANIIKKTDIQPPAETIIVTGDFDTLQLVDESTKVMIPKKGISDSVLYGEKEVKDRFGFSPAQMNDYKGLKGDPSDNIPGVPGVGEKTATELIKQFGTIDVLYKELSSGSPRVKKLSEKIREKLENNKETAFFSKELVTIKRDVELDFDIKKGRWGSFDEGKIKELLREYEFYSLLNKIPFAFSKDRGGEEEHTKQQTGAKEKEGGKTQDTKTLEYLKDLRASNTISQKIYDIEVALTPVLKGMEQAGIRIDQKQFTRILDQITKKIVGLETEIIALAGTPFNINSPQQVSEILFQKLKLSSKGLKKTPGGVISTAADELSKLRGQHRIVDNLLEYRELAKLKTTYVDSLPKLVNSKTGRIHTTFHQLGTATGRISSSDPNLQNIPIRGEWGKKIRRAFIPEEGFIFLSADYSQMELRVAAAIAHDKKMLQFFREGKDVHRMTASQVFSVKEEEVTEEMRALAKTLNFGVLYGMGIRGFQEAAHVSAKEAKEFIQEYAQKFSGITRYVQHTKESVQEKGYAETRLGRKRYIPEIHSLDPRLKRTGERIAINLPIQGLAADIMKIAMVSVSQVLKKTKKDARLILQVHDELLFEIKPHIISSFVPPIRKAMETAYTLEVPLRVDIKKGPNWADLEKIGPVGKEGSGGNISSRGGNIKTAGF